MSSEKRKVLLLDDDYASMAPLKDLLEALCHIDVDLSASKETLDRLRTVRYDLLCIDIMILPKSLDVRQEEVENIHFDGVHWQKTGLAFLERLRRGDFAAGERSTSPNVPVIVLSAIPDDSLEGAGYRDGPTTRQLEKPYEVEVLINTITEMIGESTP